MSVNLPILETARLTLRELSMTDIKDLFEYASDVETAYMGLWRPFTTLQESHDEIERIRKAYQTGEHYYWAIEHRRSVKLIGSISLNNYNKKDARADLSFALNRDFRGQGFATEACRAALKFAFTQLNLNRVGAVCLPDNEASTHMLTKLGMHIEGIRREYALVGGRYEDLQVFSILRREWFSKYATGRLNQEQTKEIYD